MKSNKYLYLKQKQPCKTDIGNYLLQQWLSDHPEPIINTLEMTKKLL